MSKISGQLYAALKAPPDILHHKSLIHLDGVTSLEFLDLIKVREVSVGTLRHCAGCGSIDVEEVWWGEGRCE